MNIYIDKRNRAAQFRERLRQALQLSGISQAALARNIGVDRSTISQLLGDSGARLPNAQIVGECAAALNVSADWLLSLSDRPENATDIVANSLSLTRAPRALVDEQIYQWHRDAAGYKIRHVPATLPDMFKTDAMLEWEYAPQLGRTIQQAIGASKDRLNWMRQSTSDYEIAIPIHEMVSFATSQGYYRDLPPEVRAKQIRWLVDLCDQFYPRVRIYLFDSRRLYSAPVTVFGPLLAVLYVGRHYLAFRESERVHSFTEHFDALIREASFATQELEQFFKTHVKS